MLLFRWIAVLCVFATTGYSQPKPEREIRRLGNIHTIVNTSDFELIFTDRGGAGTLIAQGRKEGIETLVTDVQSGTLTISQTSPKNHLPRLPFFNAQITVKEPLKIVISCPDLKKYTTNGAGPTVFLAQRFQHLDIDAEGPGLVHLSKCQMYSVDAKLKGVGQIVFENSKTVDGQFRLEGNGSIKAHDLRSKNIKAEIFGEGKVTTWAREYLNGKVVGKGVLQYRDNPSSIDRQTEKGGVIDRYFPESRE